MEYRPIPDDRMDEYHSVIRYAFRLHEGPVSDDDDGEKADAGDDEDGGDEHTELAEPRGLFDGEDLQSVCRHYYRDAYVRGEWREVAGLSAVGTPPEHRYGGLVERLLEESLSEYRERDVDVSILWPFEYGFYAKYGWDTLASYARYECPPEALSFARPAGAGSFEPVGVDDFDRLREAHGAFAERFEFSLARDEEWWRERVFGGWRGEPFAYAWVDDGDVRGYVTYHVEREDDERELQVRDFVYADEEAYRNLLRFFAVHDSQVDTVVHYGPPDTRLLDLTDQPAEVDCSIELGPMVRLVDVAAAVEALSYPADLDGSLSVAVTDPLVDWNEGLLTVELEAGVPTADLESTDESTLTDPDAETDVGTLSQLYAGYHSLETARRDGGLTVNDERAADLLASMYPPKTVLLADFF